MELNFLNNETKFNWRESVWHKESIGTKGSDFKFQKYIIFLLPISLIEENLSLFLETFIWRIITGINIFPTNWKLYRHFQPGQYQWCLADSLQCLCCCWCWRGRRPRIPGAGGVRGTSVWGRRRGLTRRGPASTPASSPAPRPRYSGPDPGTSLWVSSVLTWPHPPPSPLSLNFNSPSRKHFLLAQPADDLCQLYWLHGGWEAAASSGQTGEWCYK